MPDATKLSELMDATDAILERAKAAPLTGPVNWADLWCVEASIVLAHGSMFYRVTIEEADPSAVQLRKFVAQALFEAGWGDVNVMMEW